MKAPRCHSAFCDVMLRNDIAIRLLHLLVDQALLLAPELRREHIYRQALELATEALGSKHKEKVPWLAVSLADAAIALLDSIELSGGEVGHA